MTPLTVLGQVALFRLVAGAEQLESMSERERRLLVGALNFHALMAADRTFDAHLYEGSWQDLPRTTDDATFHGLSRSFARRELSLTVRSVVPAERRVHHPHELDSDELVAHPSRHLHISRDDVLEKEPPRDVVGGGYRRVLRKLRNYAPLLYDELRDVELRRHRAGLTTRADRRDYDREFRDGGAFESVPLVLAAPTEEGSTSAVLIGLHWFELGGAERWAFETVRIVREAGFLPIVLTNRDSHQAWIARAELDGALVIPFSEPTVASQTTGTEQLLRALFRSFEIRGVVVHHNQWLYDRLPWITRSRPGIPVIDSTHIVEYRGGGYPRASAVATESISTHHVISPSRSAGCAK
ncbi:glycosyltransferase family 4 protein, partial [Microbacterium sp. B24]|uniref:glycosyltransferase family 4 protein n=1 Tax=Microbacterium sp. B24 TaxID=95616 RepID=UPI0011D287CE